MFHPTYHSRLSFLLSGDRNCLSVCRLLDRPQAAQVPRVGQRRLLRPSPLLHRPRRVRHRAHLVRLPLRRQGGRAQALCGEWT